MKILVINSGSSSLKCTLFQMPERRPTADALVGKIGEGDAEITFDAGQVSFKRSTKAQNHSQALDAVLGCLQKESLAGDDHTRGNGAPDVGSLL